jgi:hypothetical protein
VQCSAVQVVPGYCSYKVVLVATFWSAFAFAKVKGRHLDDTPGQLQICQPVKMQVSNLFKGMFSE